MALLKANGVACSKCGRRNVLAPAQIEVGFTCPRCGTFNHPEKPADASQQDENKEEPKGISCACPLCKLACEIPKERRFKLLALCPNCSSIFVRPKTPQNPPPRS